MHTRAALAPELLARARADQVAALYARAHFTTLSMGLGALIFCGALWRELALGPVLTWLALIALNQAWRTALAGAWRRARPGTAAAPRWGRYWAAGSGLAGALWGLAAWVGFPSSPAQQVLLVVCLFGVVFGGLNLTVVYKPSFYAFVLPALVPLIARVALEGDAVHAWTAVVMSVVLAFVLMFGHHVNDVLTESLAMRYENVDLIAELRTRSRAAQEARAAAEAANRAKSQLLAAASHDLRQPLHALGLYVAALAAQPSDRASRELVQSVQAAATTLDGEFEHLLDLSRLEAGALAVEADDVALAPLFARVVAEFAPLAASRGLALRAVPTRAVVRTDPQLFGRILRNLVANALRYTRDGGVCIGTRRRGAQVRVDVVDTGIGIAAEHRARVFDEFYQVAAADGTRAAGGMGLGLAIVRRFATLLGHDVALDSRPGRGSRFSVLLTRVEAPPSRPARYARAPAGDASAHVALATSARREAAVIGAAATTPSRPAADGLAGALIAVVDDDRAALTAMRALFGTWGASVVGGVDAHALLAACGEAGRYPDLIVADLHLGDGGDGIATVLRVRDELGVALPALVVSGDTSAAARRRVRSAGLALLAKPVQAPALAAAAAALIAAGSAAPAAA